MADFVADYYAFLVDKLSAAYAMPHRPRVAPTWAVQKNDSLKDALNATWPRDGLVLEFGVWKGVSLNDMAAAAPEKTVYGFDSFVGFPDDGRVDWSMDLSRQGKLPEVRSNVELVVGYFEDTLRPFMAEHPGPVGFLHVDCDIYSSTRTVFQELGDRLGPGAVIVFDELLHCPGFENNEMLAFYEFLVGSGLDFDWISGYGRVIDFTSYCLQPTLPHKIKVWLAMGFEQEFGVRLKSGPFKPSAAAVRIAEILAEVRPLNQPLRADSRVAV